MANNFLGGSSSINFNGFKYTIDAPLLENQNPYNAIAGFFRIFDSEQINLGDIFYFTTIFTESEWLDTDNSSIKRIYYAIRKEGRLINYYIRAPIYYYDGGVLSLYGQSNASAVQINYERIMESYVFYLSEVHPLRSGMYIRTLSKKKYLMVDNNKNYNMAIFAVFGHSNVGNTTPPNPLYMKIIEVNRIQSNNIVKSILNSDAVVIDFTLPFEVKVMDVMYKDNNNYISNLQIGHMINRRYGLYIDLTTHLQSAPFKPSYDMRR